jgi:hypothetical protein
MQLLTDAPLLKSVLDLQSPIPQDWTFAKSPSLDSQLNPYNASLVCTENSSPEIFSPVINPQVDMVMGYQQTDTSFTPLVNSPVFTPTQMQDRMFGSATPSQQQLLDEQNAAFSSITQSDMLNEQNSGFGNITQSDMLNAQDAAFGNITVQDMLNEQNSGFDTGLTVGELKKELEKIAGGPKAKANKNMRVIELSKNLFYLVFQNKIQY